MVGGCATHPLPDDVSRKTTYDIVKRMRCEIRDGIAKSSFPIDLPLSTVWVGFDFILTMTEDNDATAGKLKFVNPVSGGSFSLDLGASSEKSRINERTFRVVDSLQRISEEGGCDAESQRKNFVYPITGHIGLDEMVVTFSRIKSLTPIRTVTDTSTNVFTDKLTFTTTLTAGATPELKVAAAQVGSIELTESSIMGSVTRKDDHKVTVALAIGDSVPGGSAKVLSRRTVDKQVVDMENVTPSAVPGPVTPAPDSSAASKVIDELNRQRYRDDLRDFPALRIQ